MAKLDYRKKNAADLFLLKYFEFQVQGSTKWERLYICKCVGSDFSSVNVFCFLLYKVAQCSEAKHGNRPRIASLKRVLCRYEDVFCTWVKRSLDIECCLQEEVTDTATDEEAFGGR